MTSTHTKRVPPVLLGLLALFAGTCVQASSFTVSPTRIPLSAKHQAVTVRLLNLGDEPLTLQAHVVAWTLSENQDSYRDSDDVLINPPIVTLEPHKPQLIRLGLRRPFVEGDEIAYRLIVEEVPPAPKPGVMGLRTILRITIPIFVEPPGGARKQVEWKAEHIPSGGYEDHGYQQRQRARANQTTRPVAGGKLRCACTPGGAGLSLAGPDARMDFRRCADPGRPKTRLDGRHRR